MTRAVDDPKHEAAGRFDFVERKYTRFELVYMAILDGLFSSARFALMLGGRPLKRLLIVGLGRLGYWLLGRYRRIALTNLDLVYGDDLSETEKRELALKAFRHYVRFSLDFLFDDVYWPLSERRDRLTRQNAEALDVVRKEGRGSILFSGHLGNIELGMALINSVGFETHAIFKGFTNAWFDRFIGRKRLRSGYRLVEVPRKQHEVVDGVKRRLPRQSIRPELEKIWRSNQAVGVAFDQYGGKGGLEIPFLGVPDAPTTVGALGYALESQIPITLQICVYDGDEDSLIWNIEEPIFIEEQPGGPPATLEHYARLVNDWLSEQILRYPEQFAWQHRRFAHHYYDRPRPVRPDPPKPA